MKKIIALLLALAMMCAMTASLAEGRTPPADKSIITYDLECGVTTSFRKYEPKFWDVASEQPGTVVRLDYTTDVYADLIGGTLESWVNVYLPYGYDESKQYNIYYFFPGTNEMQDSFIMMPKGKEVIDNLIETGYAEPFIMVFPSYYYDYPTRATDKDLFAQELRNDIMPAVESTYSTYAPTPDTEGFIASREHRAMGGYSQGCMATWTCFKYLVDCVKWWTPMAGGGNVDSIIASIEAQRPYSEDIFIYEGVGGPRDIAYEGTVKVTNDMVNHPEYFSFGTDPKVNNLFCTISKEPHTTILGRYYMYNAFIDVMFK